MAVANPAMNLPLPAQEYKDSSNQPSIAPTKPTQGTFTVGPPCESILPTYGLTLDSY